MRQCLAGALIIFAASSFIVQLDKPSATAKSVGIENPPAPPAPVVVPAKQEAKPAAPVQYETVKVCNNGVCHLERRPIANVVGKLTGTNCNCGCGCSSCNCGYQSVQQADPVRRTFFGRRYSGRGLFGGRLFSGRLFGRGCGR